MLEKKNKQTTNPNIPTWFKIKHFREILKGPFYTKDNFHLHLEQVLNAIFSLPTLRIHCIKNPTNKREMHRVCCTVTWPFLHNHSIHRAQHLLHIIFHLLSTKNTTLLKLKGWNISQACSLLWLEGNNVMYYNRLMMKNRYSNTPQ